MDESTTLLSVTFANPNDPAPLSQRKLVVAYSNGETDFVSYEELQQMEARADNDIASAQDLINNRTMKKNLIVQAETICTDDLGITVEAEGHE